MAQLLADKTTTDKTSPILNDLGPVALPRIGKKERFSKPCPRHRQAGHRAGPHQYCSKPFNCGYCMGTCELCEPAKPQWSPSGRFFGLARVGCCPRHPPPGRFTCELCCPSLSAASGVRRSQWRSPSSSSTTTSDLAFGADPFGDGAASEDLAQLESQPDSEGEPFHCELYPHCGCEPAMLGFGCQ